VIGQTVSHYRITRELGAGGMGVVYEAIDTRLDRTVALKFLPPGSTSDPDAKARFVQEAKAASALDHPNVCIIHEIGETEDGHMFMVMACYEGETLKDRISRGPLPIDEAVAITRQIAEGLAKAHDREIVHRDIKPANIFLTSDGLVKILDFGLAKLAKSLDITRTGTTLGTIGYMSPEQARGGDSDHRTDLWCLGAVLYEMVTGRLPFPGDHGQAVIYSILNDDPEPVTGLRTGVPMELEQLIHRCLEKIPGARYQTAGDLASDLGRIEGLGASAVSLKPAMGGKTGPRLGRSWAMVAGSVATVVVGAVLIFGLNLGNLRDRLVGQETPGSIRSLVVLPFDNMMGDAEQDFFVEGMHEALITELSRIGTVRVISRTTAMYYRQTDKSIPEIARELDVDAVVEGSVLRVGGRVRITAQLIRGDNDEHLWAEDYDRDLQDILNLLSDVARSIAGEIDVALTPREKEHLDSERTVAPETYELYLRGLHHLHQFTEQDALQARRYFQQAISADPNFAWAHAGLSGAFIVYTIVGDLPPGDLYQQARDAAQRALELDPDNGGAHTVLGFVNMYADWDWAAAEREFNLALEQDPNNGDALHGLSSVLTIHGRFEEAADMVLRARLYDPYSYLRNLPVWINLVIAHRYEEAITEVERWREFSGNPRMGWYWLFCAFRELGRDEDAMVELRHSSTGRDSKARPALEKAYTESGVKGAALVCAERLADLSQHEHLDPISISFYFAMAGDIDKTIHWLEKAYEDRAPALNLLAQPALDPYRADPRFRDLMDRFGIPESGWEGLGKEGG